MVYLEPSAFGWRPLLTSWLSSLPPPLKEQQTLVLGLVNWLVEPCLRFVFKKLKELVVTSESNLTRSLMYLFEMLMSTVCTNAPGDKNFKSWIVVRNLCFDPHVSTCLHMSHMHVSSLHSPHSCSPWCGRLERHVIRLGMICSVNIFVSCTLGRWRDTKCHQPWERWTARSHLKAVSTTTCLSKRGVASGHHG